jgi:hypothetical protein
MTMKTLLAIALIAAATPAIAQTTPAPAPAPVAAAPAAPASSGAGAPVAGAKFTLDTPIETIMADPKGKAVLTADLGGDPETNPQYDAFKGMSLNAVAPYAADKITPEVLKKVEADLAAIQ